MVINDVDPLTADATAKDAAKLGSKSLAVVADVAKSTDIARMIDTVIAERGRVDILVNNAMKIVPGKLEALPEAAWDTTMNIGLKGAFLVSQAAAKHMIAQKSGCIVNIASIAGLFPYNWAGAYSVVKAGLIMLTKLQAMEWAPYGIRANAITPGHERTLRYAGAMSGIHPKTDINRQLGHVCFCLRVYESTPSVLIFLALPLAAWRRPALPAPHAPPSCVQARKSLCQETPSKAARR